MNGKAWLGRLLPRKAPAPAKATRKASRRPSSPLRELEREQAALRARLDALGTALDAASVALPEQERTALRQVPAPCAGVPTAVLPPSARPAGWWS